MEFSYNPASRFENDSIVAGLIYNVGLIGNDTVEKGDWEGHIKFIEQKDDTLIYDASWFFNRILFESCIAGTDLSLSDIHVPKTLIKEYNDTIVFKQTNLMCIELLTINAFWKSDTLLYEMLSVKEELINYNHGKWYVWKNKKD